MGENIKISDKKIMKSVEVPLCVKEVWKKWTTHEGLLTFFGEDNKIELFPGGAFEIYFLIDEPYGLRGSEECKILSYLPEKMLSFTWNAPPSIPQIRISEYKTWVVVEFNSVNESNTEIVLTHVGWPEDTNWDSTYQYFDNAWEIVLLMFLESITNHDVP